MNSIQNCYDFVDGLKGNLTEIHEDRFEKKEKIR